MEWLEVLNRISQGEDEHTEFKRGLGDMSAVGRTVCALANTRGGVLIIGVSDQQEIVGVSEDAEKVQERLTSFMSNGCSSPVSARLCRQESPSGWVHWVDVPHQRGFEPLRYSGRVWVRRGRSSVEPSSIELQELYNAFGYILTEVRTIESATISDIDLSRFHDYLRRQGLETEEMPQPSSEDDLRNRGVLKELGGLLRPTLYGVLAFGNDPQRYPQTRNFWIECVAYGGDDRSSEVLQVADAGGRLDDQLQRAVGWFSGLGKSELYGTLLRIDRPMLPEVAIRESLVNAVVHRDYSITGSKILFEVFRNYVDVTSPGCLPNRMTTDSVRAGGRPRSRNELMANYMLSQGFMERRGRGWPLMRRAMREFNSSEPDLSQDYDGKFVRLRFHL